MLPASQWVEQAGNLRCAERHPILVQIPLVNFPANPTARNRTYAADKVAYKHVGAQRVRRPPEAVTANTGPDEDG